MKHSLSLLIFLIASPLFAEAWNFSCPPSSTYDVRVDGDWRKKGSMSLTLHMEDATPDTKILCKVYIQTKTDLWFETRTTFALDGSEQRVKLSLEDDSSDWLCANAARPYGRDALRWIRSWGVTVFSREPAKGTLHISKLSLRPQANVTPELELIPLPDQPVPANHTCPVSFRIANMNGTPYDTRAYQGHLIATHNAGHERVPVFFKQNYTHRTHPGTGAATLVPTERPMWTANWTPSQPGTYKMSLSMKAQGTLLTQALGSVTVTNAPAPPPLPAGTQRLRPLQALTTYRLFEQVKSTWLPVPVPPSRTVWHAPLDWTEKWGHYTGAGEFNQLVAWHFQQDLDAAMDAPRPLLIFTESELAEQGIFNWLSHPLNHDNGGTLRRKADVFSSEHARTVMLNRARYLYARFGNHPAVSGLLISCRRPYSHTTDWLESIASELSTEFPKLRILSDNPGLPARCYAREIPFDRTWKNDKRLAPGTQYHTDPTGKNLVIVAPFPKSAAMICTYIRHWAGARILSCDIQVPATPKGNAKVMCMLRTARDTVFQSKLIPLHRDEWNRVQFDLQDTDNWTCLQDPQRKLGPYDLLNIRQFALRFFSDAPSKTTFRLKHCSLLWPYAIDRKHRPALAITDVQGKQKEIPQFSHIELNFLINRIFGNPYDPAEIDVMCELTDPSGTTLRHPGFYYEPWKLPMIDGKEQAIRGPAAPSWRLRFTPWKPGRYTWKLVAVSDDETATATGSFMCTPSDAKGFVGISKKDGKYFEMSDGSFYFPIGHNLRSPSDARTSSHSKKTLLHAAWADRNGTRAYELWFKRMQANGENFSRIWMCPWWCGLEWNRSYGSYHGLGYYNQANAARLDRLMEMAEREQVYINLELMNHGRMSTLVDSDWNHNPFNRKTQPGGILDQPLDYLDDQRANTLHRNRLRYAVARWGHSTAIAWWGLMTEAEWCQPYDRRSMRGRDHRAFRQQQERFIDWLDNSLEFVRTTDAHPHPASIHFSMPQNGWNVWKRPSMEVVHNNAYTYFAQLWRKDGLSRASGVAEMMRVFASAYDRSYRNKPLIIGEWGGDPRGNKQQQLVAELHTGLWSMTMTPTSGLTGYWWWHLIDDMDLYGDFAAVANFMKDEDRRGKRYETATAVFIFTPPEGTKKTTQPPRAGLVLSNKHELFAYLYHPSINHPKTATVGKGFEDPAFPESGKGKLRVPPALQPGAYRLEFWNTYTGKVISSHNITITKEQRHIPLMNHRVDLALKLKRMDDEQVAHPHPTDP